MKKIVSLLFSIFIIVFLNAQEANKGNQFSPEQEIVFIQSITKEKPKVAKAMIKGLISELENNKDQQNNILADAYFTLALIENIEKNFSEAYQFLCNCLDLNNQHVNALITRGNLLKNLSRFNDARLDYEKAKKIDPKNERLKKYMAQMEDYLKANPNAEDQSESLKIQPSSK